MKTILLFWFFLFSSFAYGACSDYHSGGSCVSPCVWLSGGGGRCSDPVNTAPTDISLSPTSVAENLPSGTAVGTFTTTDTAGNTHTYTLVSGTGSTDNASFSINSNQLLTNTVFDYETKNSYSIRVRSTDQGSLYFEKIFIISVNNVNEAPTVTSGASTSINENIPTSTVVYTITATDPDTGQTLTYGIGGTDSGYLNVNSTTGAITFKNSPDYESKTSYSITVTATDNGSPNLSASKAVTIQINNLNDNPVIISDSNSAANSVAENAAIGSTVGITAYATDADSGATITGFSLTNDAGGLFAIHASTGVVTVASTLDYETAPSHTITVLAVSSDGSSATQNFTIQVIDVVETPIADYRFDACSWSGTSADVLDSSGNGYNATAQNSLTTVNDGKICRGTIFNGTNHYITIPSTPASVLRGTASLSFWVKTTQSGNNTSWLAPGITGIEEAGGTNDIFWGWIDAGGKIAISTGNNTAPKSTIAINDGQWRHIVLTRSASNGTLQIYINGVLNATGSGASGTIGNSFTSIGRIEDTGGSPAYFYGNLDEVKIFSSVLSASQIATMYANEAAGRNYNDPTVPRSCTTCSSGCSAFNYTIYHPLNAAGRLDSRIASTPFDVNITVACSDSGTIPARKITKLYGVIGNCPTSTTGLPVLWSGSRDINDTLRTITLTGANSVKAYPSLRLMAETNASELNCSTDTMALRPASFAITSPASPLKAGAFNLSATAANSAGGYTGTAKATTALQTPNPGCPKGSGFFAFASGGAEPLSLSFVNDTNTSAMKATDVGSVWINLKDANWTAVDQPTGCISDSNTTLPDSTGKVGCNIESNLSVRIVPHHFAVDANLTNFAGGSFTYLSTDLNLSAPLGITATAQTETNTTTENYTALCVANPTVLNVSYAVPSVYPSNALSRLNYLETNTSLFGSVASTAASFTLTLPKTLFAADTNGTARASILLNYDRNESKPVNPFDLNLTSLSVTDPDGVIGSDTTAGNAAFIYGRIRGYDIQTDQNSVPNPIEIELYGSGSTHPFLSGKPQNLLYWYRNTSHNGNAAGSVLGTNTFDPSLSVSTATPPLAGLHPIQIVYTQTAPITKTIHLSIPLWLWYSPLGLSYVATGTDCKTHPCFVYRFSPAATGTDALSTGTKGVNSGTFQGSDFGIEYEKNTVIKGIKTFR